MGRVMWGEWILGFATGALAAVLVLAALGVIQ